MNTNTIIVQALDGDLKNRSLVKAFGRMRFLDSRHEVQRAQLAHIEVASTSLCDCRTFPLILLLVSLYTNQLLLLSKQHTMKSFLTFGTALLGLSHSVTNAVAVPVEHMEMARIETRDTLKSRQSPAQCVNGGHGPNTRHCWAPGFSMLPISRR
jgi:hypothetical protein